MLLQHADVGEHDRIVKIKDEILIQIIRQYLPDILSGNLSTITRALGITTAYCRSCIRKIGELNPRPIMSYEGDQTDYLVPDVLVSREGDCWKVVLNDGWMGDYKYGTCCFLQIYSCPLDSGTLRFPP